MWDIYWGVAVVLLLAALVGYCVYRLARRWRWAGVSVAIVCTAGLALNVAFFRHSLRVVRWIPLSNVMVLGDPDPELAAVLIGVGAALMPGSAGRRSVLLVPLGLVALGGSYGGFFLGAPPIGDQWSGVVCRQTTQATCGPAAEATLLRAYGVRTSEAEMARLSLTSVDGTGARAIYRGLRLKTLGSDLSVKPFFGTVEDLRKVRGPVLLLVRLDARPGIDPRYQQKWGWVPGVAHVVVMFRCRADGTFVVGDPAMGLELWNRDAIETLWHGEGLQLVKGG